MTKITNGFAAIFMLGLAACSNDTIIEGDKETVTASFEAAVASLSDNRARQQGYPLALYRAVVPPEVPVVEDDFDPSVELKLATDRANSPNTGSEAYLATIQGNAYRVAGMDPATVVDKYVSQDGGALTRQEQWARSWQARHRIKSKNEADEIERRKRLLSRFKAIKPVYWWEGGRPHVKFFMFNPLDVPLDRVETDFDLFDQTGQQRLGSSRIQGILRTPLQPGAEATVLIELSQYEGLAKQEFRNLGETFHVQIAFRNAWSGQRSLIDRDENDDAKSADRNKAVVNLLSRIAVARENLSKFRVTFAQR